MKFACFITFSIALAMMPAASVLAQQYATRDRTVNKPASNFKAAANFNGTMVQPQTKR